MATNFTVNFPAAFHVFNQAAADAYDQQLTEDELKAFVEQQDQILDQHWSVLTELAFLGMEGEIAAPLEALLCEWARKKGYQVILENFGMMLDQTDWQLILKRFGQALQRKHQVLSSELRMILARGREEREQAAQARSERLQPFVTTLLQEQHDQAVSWYENAGRTLRDREEAIWEGQAIAHQWAFLAQDSMKQQQDGLDSQYQFATHLHSQVSELLAPVHQEELAYNAVSQYRSEQLWGRMGCILIGLLISAALIGLGVYLMFHIV